MADVQNVARFFIDIAQRQSNDEIGDLMTNLRLQKLLHFAQGWYLSRFRKPLFHAPLEAWPYGPVVPEVYQKQTIEYELLLDVAREYGTYSTSALVKRSHAPEAPWSHTERSHEIPTNEIQAYFAGKDDKLLSFDDIPNKASDAPLSSQMMALAMRWCFA